MKILIVDDEAPAILNMKSVLSNVSPQAELREAGDAQTALAICREWKADIAFLDIEMPDRDGLALAKELIEIQPNINVIITTAYPQYALDALKLYVSGYILKPAMEDEVRDVLDHLRNPVIESSKGLYVQCFGNFEVFYNGEIVRFGRRQAKEMFAYLISLNGAGATSGELCAVLLEETKDITLEKTYIRQYYMELKKALARYHMEDVVLHSRESYSINPQKIACDYYRYLENHSSADEKYRGEFMKQYSWAEMVIGNMYE